MEGITDMGIEIVSVQTIGGSSVDLQNQLGVETSARACEIQYINHTSHDAPSARFLYGLDLPRLRNLPRMGLRYYYIFHPSVAQTVLAVALFRVIKRLAQPANHRRQKSAFSAIMLGMINIPDFGGERMRRVHTQMILVNRAAGAVFGRKLFLSPYRYGG